MPSPGFESRTITGFKHKADTFLWYYVGEEAPTTHTCLTLNLLTTTIVAPPSNASKWQMGFNSAFKGLNAVNSCFLLE